MEWQLVAPTLIELVLLFTVCILFIAVGVLNAKLKALKASQDTLHTTFNAELERIESLAKNANHQQSEAQARSLVITRHLQTLDEKQSDIESQLRELKMQDPSLRLYQRAAELVKQGATIDEIIEACDIPRAEAEMLMMVHRQSN